VVQKLYIQKKFVLGRHWSSDQAPLGRGVGKEIAPTTSWVQAPFFQDDCIGGGFKPRSIPSSLHPIFDYAIVVLMRKRLIADDWGE